MDPDDYPSACELALETPDCICDGSGELHHVRTPTIDHRDPAYKVDTSPCAGCTACMGYYIDPSGSDPEKFMFRITADGQLELGPGVTFFDSSAEDFWRSLVDKSPARVKADTLREVMAMLENKGTVGAAAALMVAEHFDLETP